MKTKLTFLIAMLSITVFSQEEFAPIGAEWYYNYRESMDGPETGYYLLKSIKDTTIDSKVCRILSHTLMNSKGISMNKGESILYEDVKENRIYRYLFGNFYLLYDFTKTTGDTIIVKEPYSETQYDSIITVVDSVGIETVAENIQLKVLYVRPVEGRKYDFQGKIVEKIGNLHYLFPFNQLDCDGGCPLPLRCYNDDQISFVSHEPYAMQVPCDYIYPEIMNEFAPIGAKWYFNYPNSTSNDYVVFESKKDSTIQGKDSRVIDVRLNNSRLVSREYIHQNGDSIFYYNENYNSFFLLYDFSAKAGDTITVHPAKFKPTKAFFSYDDSITDFKYKILLVDSVQLSGQWIKRQKVTLLKNGLWGFSKPDGKDYYIINKIGSLAYFFGVQSGITPEDKLSICRCYSDSDFEFKNPLWASECDLIDSGGVSSQTEWAPTGAEWYYTYTEGAATPATGYYQLKSIKDTLIDSKQCKVIEKTLVDSRGNESVEGFEYIYTEISENKVYRYKYEDFYLLYDFTKEVGDTIIIKEPYSVALYDSIVLIVDSISLEVISDTLQLKTYYVNSILTLSNPELQFSGKIIEKIGNYSYFFPNDQLVCDGGCPDPLRCYSDELLNYVSYYPYPPYYPYSWPCDTFYTSSILVSLLDVDIYPNPFRNFFVIEVGESSADPFVFEIYNQAGRIVAQQRQFITNKYTENTSTYPPGIYFVKVWNNKKQIFKKLIKF